MASTARHLVARMVDLHSRARARALQARRLLRRAEPRRQARPPGDRRHAQLHRHARPADHGGRQGILDELRRICVARAAAHQDAARRLPSAQASDRVYRARRRRAGGDHRVDQAARQCETPATTTSTWSSRATTSGSAPRRGPAPSTAPRSTPISGSRACRA